MVPLIAHLILSIIPWGSKYPHLGDEKMEERKGKRICLRFQTCRWWRLEFILVQTRSSHLISHGPGVITMVHACGVSRDLCVTKTDSVSKTFQGTLSSSPWFHSWTLIQVPQEYLSGLNLLIPPSYTLTQSQREKPKGSGASRDSSQHLQPFLGKRIRSFQRLQRRTEEAQDLETCGML